MKKLITCLNLFLLLFIIGVGQLMATSATWTLVTSEPADWSGEYLIVYGDGCVDGSLTSGFDQHTRKSVTITNNQITLDDSYSVTVAVSGQKYSIQTASGYYFGRNANSNGMDFSDTWSNNYTVVFSNWNSTNKTVKIKGNGGRALGRNGNVWRFYSNSNDYTNVSLYKKGASCSTKLTLTHGDPAPSNGSFKLTTHFLLLSPYIEPLKPFAQTTMFRPTFHLSSISLYILCIYPVILISRVFSLFQYVKDQLSKVLSVRIEHYFFIVFYIIHLLFIRYARVRTYDCTRSQIICCRYNSEMPFVEHSFVFPNNRNISVYTLHFSIYWDNFPNRHAM